ncbi:MAG: alpha/beta hydrolase-fold protein, partial [Limnochordia bacterium]
GHVDNQRQIDDQVAALKAAMDQLKPAANEKVFYPLPSKYKLLSSQQGTTEVVHYQAPNRSGGKDNKKLLVYLPYGYYDEGNNRKYNVLYLMHGGGENENLLFGGPGQNTELKRIIDNMIAFGDIEPLIVVTPTFYGGVNDAGDFHKELVDVVIPLVETKYRTHLTNGDREDMKDTRNHRAFGGFSMGGLSTWYTFIFALDYVKYFMPLSGDCWIIPASAGANRARLTAEYLQNVVRAGGYEPTDYYLLCATGDQDIAYGNMLPQINAMKQLKDTFIYSGDVSQGNFYFMVAKGGTHWWGWVNQYIWNILPDMFRD